MLEMRVPISRDWSTVNARERVRVALKARLDHLQMTNRAFGKAFSANAGKGHVDTWVSALLKGQFALSLDELDEAASILKTTATELVKSPQQLSDYLTPTEHRILSAIRVLPPVISDHFLMLAEYLVGLAPDEIDHVLEFRKLTLDEKTKVRHWTHALWLGREPMPALAILPDRSEIDAQPKRAEHRTRGQRRRKR